MAGNGSAKPMTIREGLLERFSFSAVFLPVGLAFVFSGPGDGLVIVAGIGLVIYSLYAIARGIFFSSSTRIDFEAGQIVHTRYGRKFFKEFLTIPKGSISRLAIEDRITTEEGKQMCLELQNGMRLDLPDGSHRKRKAILEALSELEGHPVPIVERQT